MNDIDQPIDSTPDQNRQEQVQDRAAFVYTSCEALAAYTIADLAGNTDADHTIEGVIGGIERLLNEKSTESKHTLAANILTLDAIFHRMVRYALLVDDHELMMAYMDIALKAQNQARKTTLALEQVKNPGQRTFVALQNISQVQQVQQVNNALLQELSPENILKDQNKVLSEATHALLDTRRAEETISVNTGVGTLEGLDRAQNCKRQSLSENERL